MRIGGGYVQGEAYGAIAKVLLGLLVGHFGLGGVG